MSGEIDDPPPSLSRGEFDARCRPATWRRLKGVPWVLVVVIPCAYTGWKVYDFRAARQSVYRFLETAADADSFTVTAEYYDEAAHRMCAKCAELVDDAKVRQFAAFFAGKRPVFDLTDLSAHEKPETDLPFISELTARARRGSSYEEVIGGDSNVFCTMHLTCFFLPGYSAVDAFTWLQTESEWVDVDLASLRESRRRKTGE